MAGLTADPTGRSHDFSDAYSRAARNYLKALPGRCSADLPALAEAIVSMRPWISWDHARRRMIHALHRSQLVDLWLQPTGEIDQALALAFQS